MRRWIDVGRVAVVMLGAMGLSGCITSAIQDELQPLRVTVNSLKSEIRAVQQSVALDSAKPEADRLYALSCAGTVEPTTVAFQSVTVTLAANAEVKTEGEAGIDTIITLGGSGAQSRADTDKLVLNLTPEPLDPDWSAATYPESSPQPDGVAEALLALLAELAAVDDTRPCFDLDRGDKPTATMSLGFAVTDERVVNGGIEVAVLKVGGKETRTRKASNTITVAIGLPDGVTLSR